ESNPMKWVSATTVSDYEAVSLSPEESFAILERISDPLVRVLVIVVAITATRIGEALGLMWSDIDWKKLKINIRRDWVDGQLGRPKSRASKAAVEMHETLAALLQGWRQKTPYNKDSDFLFPSFKLHGKQPRLGSMIVEGYIRPAAVAAGVIPEDCPRFGFHNLRHGLSTFLIDNGQDPVVETEPRTIFRDHPGSYRCRSNVALDDHAAEPGLFAMQLEGRKQKIRVLVVRSFLTPALQQGREEFRASRLPPWKLVILDARVGRQPNRAGY